jgi:hypothetical protein
MLNVVMLSIVVPMSRLSHKHHLGQIKFDKDVWTKDFGKSTGVIFFGNFSSFRNDQKFFLETFLNFRINSDQKLS